MWKIREISSTRNPILTSLRSNDARFQNEGELAVNEHSIWEYSPLLTGQYSRPTDLVNTDLSPKGQAIKGLRVYDLNGDRVEGSFG